ncbi:uncharacterized protein A4U43_C04F18380 [Asparagus officinalis]|uniref:WRC domain-containing protein n=1 Tax=Asparagus officinalis TaxID=4686 RepID=A0A5P1F6I7_ASPOF|nr:uncharacterized protein A4U43_C04F18380 [Asparagus officinalis]
MRIRRNASKILGSASLAYAANPNRPSTPATAPGAEAEGLTVCELNCSPWDLMATDPNSSYCDFLITDLKALLIIQCKHARVFFKHSAAAELTLKEMKEIEEKKLVKRRRVSKGKERDAAVAFCKKTDGKGWHCKRQAQLPNSLCSYHLAQIKAYSSNHRALTEQKEGGREGGNG